MCRLGRCWYSASSKCTDRETIIGEEMFQAPSDFTVKGQSIFSGEKKKKIHTDLVSGRPFVLKIKKRKMDGKSYGSERVFLIPVADKEGEK